MQKENYNELNSDKSNIMWDLLSDQRKLEVDKIITDTISKFEQSGKVEINKIYPFEITQGFDQDKNDVQYIYLRCAFRFNEIPPNIFMPINGMPIPKNIVDVRVLDIEVFKEDEIFDWLDHVNRIEKEKNENKENQLFYEDNIFTKEEDIKPDEKDNKYDNEHKPIIKNLFSKESINPKQTNINKPIENKEGIEDKIFGYHNFSDLINTNMGSATTFNNNIDFGEPPHLIPKKELFDFYSKSEPDKSNAEYLSIFRTYSRNIVNFTMLIYYNHKDDSEMGDNHVMKLIHALKNLQNNFSNCDFWKFSRYELGQLGFINWSDEILLIPIWAFPVILKNSKDKIVFTPTREEILIRDIDVNENPIVKFGCVSYGFKIS